MVIIVDISWRIIQDLRRQSGKRAGKIEKRVDRLVQRISRMESVLSVLEGDVHVLSVYQTKLSSWIEFNNDYPTEEE